MIIIIVLRIEYKKNLLTCGQREISDGYSLSWLSIRNVAPRRGMNRRRVHMSL